VSRLEPRPAGSYTWNVAFFSSILDFKKTFLTRLRDKRSQPRYNVGAAFPLKATLILTGDSRPAKKGSTSSPASGLSWGGRVGNISSNGLSVHLPPAALTTRGEATTVLLTVEKHEIEIACVVAHFRVFSTHSVCGVQLKFDDYNVQKAYHQLVEAVRVGTSFAPAQPAKASGAQVSQQWRSVNRATLAEWRNATTHKIERFELAVGEHRLTGQTSPRGVNITPRSAGSRAPIPVSTATEVRDFIRWVAANLPKQVPADLRDTIGNLTGADQPAQGTWARPPLLR
jgi:hypothetical protein